MTTLEYKSLSLEERRVFFIAALVPVNIRTENGADGKPRYSGFADLLGAESPAGRADVLAAVDALAEKGVIKDGRPDGRTARETLAAIAEEADRRGWWPSCEVFAKAYEPIMMASISDYRRKDKTQEQLREMARDASKAEAYFSELMMAYKAVPQEDALAAGDVEIPEVKADTTCFVRLEFRDGALTVHVYTRPVAQNAQLAFEPGYVRLADGDYVALTEEMRRQLGALASAGREEDGKLEIPAARFRCCRLCLAAKGWRCRRRWRWRPRRSARRWRPSPSRPGRFRRSCARISSRATAGCQDWRHAGLARAWQTTWVSERRFRS